MSEARGRGGSSTPILQEGLDIPQARSMYQFYFLLTKLVPKHTHKEVYREVSTPIVKLLLTPMDAYSTGCCQAKKRKRPRSLKVDDGELLFV